MHPVVATIDSLVGFLLFFRFFHCSVERKEVPLLYLRIFSVFLKRPHEENTNNFRTGNWIYTFDVCVVNI